MSPHSRKPWHSVGLALIGVVAVASVVVNRLAFFSWLEGRLNNSRIVGMLLDYLGWLIGLACIAILAAIALATMIRDRKARKALVGLVVICFVPVLVPRLSPQAAFLRGFERWARSHIAGGPLLDWSDTLSREASATSVPSFWPTAEHSMELGWPVPEEKWPASIAELQPCDVRVIGGRGSERIFLSWQADSAFGWPRFVMVSRGGGGPPAEVVNHMAWWRQVSEGVYVGVRVPH